MRAIPLVALLCVVLVACGVATPTATLPPGKCNTADREQVVTIAGVYDRRWDDAVTLANNTPRNQLAGQIAALQQLRREATAAPWPTCATTVQTPMIGMMDATIAGFLDFLAERDPAPQFARADQLAAEAVAAAGKLAP